MINYFAYGSNMDEEDFEKRCNKKGWRMVKFQNRRVAKLNGYKLTFNYYSPSRKAGAANIMESKKDCAYGLLIEIEESNLETIRKKEGYPNYYDEISVDVETFDGTPSQDVKTYKVVKSREEHNHQPPTEEYMQLIIKNAKKYGFPKEYIEYLESFPTKK